MTCTPAEHAQATMQTTSSNSQSRMQLASVRACPTALHRMEGCLSSRGVLGSTVLRKLMELLEALE